MDKELRKKLLAWFEKNGRHQYPWRQSNNLYYIFLSEIMLQQTQINRVATNYFPRFIKRFPTIIELANASLDDVLALWSGLGYYKRAQNLHKSAQIIVNQKTFPTTFEALKKLPGVGKYTTSAILAFGLNYPIVVIDSNIKRLYFRLFATTSMQYIQQKAQKLLDKSYPKEYNLALMDIGATICLPKKTACLFCPLQYFCKGKNNIAAFTKTKSQKKEEKELFFSIFLKKNQIALIKSKEKLYNNLLVLPPSKEKKNYLASFTHSYTKYKLKVHLYEGNEEDQSFIWYDLKNIENAPIASLTKKALQALNLI